MKNNRNKGFNKKMVISLCILILFSISVNAATQSTQRPARTEFIIITLINQEPDPVGPGKNVDVRFKFDNNGTDEARNIEVEILPEYPFSLNPGRGAVRNIGTMQSRQAGDVGVIVKYKLRVDKNAVEGEKL